MVVCDLSLFVSRRTGIRDESLIAGIRERPEQEDHANDEAGEDAQSVVHSETALLS